MGRTMQNLIRVTGAAALLVVVVAANPAHADQTLCSCQPETETCKPNYSVNVGNYAVQTNLWNDQVSGKQCINVVDKPLAPGFTITEETGNAKTDGAPLGYPNIYIGWRYNTPSPETNLPMQIKSIRSATSATTYSFGTGGAFDGSYDIWFDDTPRKDGVSKMEVMIWLGYNGVQPAGKKAAEPVHIDNRDWQVWVGHINDGNNISHDVISYRAAPPGVPGINEIVVDVLAFLKDAREREKKNDQDGGLSLKITDEWWLTSIQAGFEPWNVQANQLVLGSFVATVEPKKMPSRHQPQTSDVSENED
jgi:hypothetical protein